MAINRSMGEFNGLLLALAVVMGLLLLIGGVGMRFDIPPDPLPATISPSDFSAARAMEYVSRIGRVTHPIGTPENAAVRDYLLEQIKSLGYTPTLQSGTVVSPENGQIGTVDNIVVKIGGRKPGKALLLTAHYDSAPSSPGAADDGASVAAALETLRALKIGGGLENDLICLLTDGEETEALGAKYFATHDSALKDIGLELNFDYRGNSGPFWMFETSAGNARITQGWIDAVPRPLGNSFLYEIYRFMPNGTDMTVFKAAGLPGMNFAAGENHTSYHTQLDRAELLDQRSLQHEGEIMLALVRHFGNSDIQDLRSGDRVYFNVPGAGLITYPAALALPLAGLVLALLCGICVLAAKNRRVRILRSIVGALAVILSSLAIAALCQLIWMVLCLIHPGYHLLLQGNTYNGAWYLAAFAALGVGFFSFALKILKRWFSPMELTLAAMFVAAMLCILTSLLLPGASFLFTWPLLPMLLALLFFHSRRGQQRSARSTTLLYFVAAVPGVLIYTPIVHILFFALTPMLLAITILLLMLFLCALTPLLQTLERAFVLPVLPLLATVALMVGASLHAGFDQEHPQPNNLFFVQNSAENKAYWLSDDEQLDRWTRTFFSETPKKEALKNIFGPNAAFRWAQAAPMQDITAPTITVLEDRSSGEQRQLSLEIRSVRRAPRIQVFVDGTPVLNSSVQGEVLTKQKTEYWRLEGYAMRDAPIHIELSVNAGKAFDVRVRDISYGLPKDGFHDRPQDMIIQPFRTSDTTQIVAVMGFK